MLGGEGWRRRDGGVEGGEAICVYSSETASPGSHFGSAASQQDLTFRYYAQLSKANKHNCGSGHLDWKAGAVSRTGGGLFKDKVTCLLETHTNILSVNFI